MSPGPAKSATRALEDRLCDIASAAAILKSLAIAGMAELPDTALEWLSDRLVADVSSAQDLAGRAERESRPPPTAEQIAAGSEAVATLLCQREAQAREELAWIAAHRQQAAAGEANTSA